MSLNGFFKRLLRLFRNKPTCRRLERSARYHTRYCIWVKQEKHISLTAEFHKAYHYKKAGLHHSYKVKLVQEQHRQGVILFYNPAITPEEFSFLFEYLKDRVILQGYKLRNADRRKISSQQAKQQIETYYFTPLPSDVPGTGVCNQRFGNIVLDYTSINHFPTSIRIIADHYSDKHFSAPLPFQELLNLLLQPTPVT